jgi:hypothetical protein
MRYLPTSRRLPAADVTCREIDRSGAQNSVRQVTPFQGTSPEVNSGNIDPNPMDYPIKPLQGRAIFGFAADLC